MRYRKRRNNRNQPAEPAEWDDEAEEKQQMIGSVENVTETHRYEGPGSLMPPRIQLHDSWIATFVLERANRTVRRQEPEHRDYPQPELLEPWTKRKAGLIRLDRVFE